MTVSAQVGKLRIEPQLPLRLLQARSCAAALGRHCVPQRAPPAFAPSGAALR